MVQGCTFAEIAPRTFYPLYGITGNNSGLAIFLFAHHAATMQLIVKCSKYFDGM